jgi:YaiO family outer membrane protein
VFANRDISQHVNFKAGDSVVLHLGGRYTEYYGDVNARIWTTGASYYRGQWISNYRYTRYHLSDREDGDSHLFSLRRKDRNGAGSTQLWLGRGSSAFAYETLPELEDSTSTSISLRRSQPLTENIKLDALIGRTLHDSPHARYHGVSSRIGVGYHW